MNALLAARVGLFGVVVVAFPAAAVAVFALGCDRHATANVLSCIYATGIPLALSTATWPLRCTRDWSPARRLESVVLLFLGMSYATHLTWELGWLVAHRVIAASPDAPWAYAWWAYIDGGDARYAHPDATLLGMEMLSVANGLVGVAALTTFLRSGRRSERATLVLALTAVVHLYSASLYFLTELLAGLPHVDAASPVALYVKFGLANLPWVTVPWLVFVWAAQRSTIRPTTMSAAPITR